MCILLSACVAVTRPVVKIALVAPFEGRYSAVGFEVIYAIRLAVREANARGGVAGYSVELLSLDDSGNPEMAAAQARKVAADPEVVAVIGHWLEATTLAAAPEYDSEGIPLLATAFGSLSPSAFQLWLTDSAYETALPSTLHCPLPCDSLEDLSWLESHLPPPTSHLSIAGPPIWQQPQFADLAGEYAEGVYVIAPSPLPADSTDPAFADRYRAISNGIEPRSYAVLAYDAAQLLFDAMARDVAGNNKPSRAGITAALAQADYSGLSGHFSFDSKHNWVAGRGWVYQWRNREMIKP